jgi:uncharacterized phage-associated protein
MTRVHDVTAHDVMVYIKDQKPDASPMELQKYAYYAQAWHVTWEGERLYPERIEAWTHGPVCKDAWVADHYDTQPAVKPLPDHARSVVDAVLAFYGRLSAPQLRALTHNETPWVHARRGLPDEAKSDAEIPIMEMRRFYTRKSIIGEEIPTRPLVNEEPTLEDTLRIADEQIERWREALDKLAAR